MQGIASMINADLFLKNIIIIFTYPISPDQIFAQIPVPFYNSWTFLLVQILLIGQNHVLDHSTKKTDILYC